MNKKENVIPKFTHDIYDINGRLLTSGTNGAALDPSTVTLSWASDIIDFYKDYSNPTSASKG